MIFLTLENGRLGVETDGVVVDVPEAARAMGRGPVPRTLPDLVTGPGEAAGRVHALAVEAAAAGIASRPRREVEPLAPFPEPRRNIICVGKNYREHVNEVKATALGGAGLPEAPIFFTKATTAVLAPGRPIPSHRGITAKLDYEAEVALVLGRGGRRIPPEAAWDHVFGYTAINDVSARDLQAGHRQWFRGKSLDGTAPMGPVVVHRSAMPPLGELQVLCRINGEERQRGDLSQLIFDVPTLIATLSEGMTLLAGDLIATGTPAGVGAGFDPPRFLRPGDVVEVEVTGVGVLRNPVMD